MLTAWFCQFTWNHDFGFVFHCVCRSDLNPRLKMFFWFHLVKFIGPSRQAVTTWHAIWCLLQSNNIDWYLLIVSLVITLCTPLFICGDFLFSGNYCCIAKANKGMRPKRDLLLSCGPNGGPQYLLIWGFWSTSHLRVPCWVPS